MTKLRLPHPANYWPFNLFLLGVGFMAYCLTWFVVSIWLSDGWATITALGGYAAAYLGTCILLLRRYS